MGSEGPSRGPGGVGRPSRRAGRVWGGPPEGTGEVGRPSRRARKGWDANLEGREGSGGVGSPFWMAGRGREALPKDRQVSENPRRENTGVGRTSRSVGRGQ